MKTNIKILRNQKGVSIIQILVLSGIFSVIFAAISKLVIMNKSLFSEITSNINIDDLNAQIYLLLLDSNASSFLISSSANCLFISVLSIAGSVIGIVEVGCTGGMEFDLAISGSLDLLFTKLDPAHINIASIAAAAA